MGYEALGSAYPTAAAAARSYLEHWIRAGGMASREDILETISMPAEDLLGQMIGDRVAREGEDGLTLGVSVIGTCDEDGGREDFVFDRQDALALIEEMRAKLRRRADGR